MMKTTLTKKFYTFILILYGMFSVSILSAQNCPSNKIWLCRYDECGIEECKCVNANNAQNWLAMIPPCNVFHPNCCNGWRVGQNMPGMGINASLMAFPNPVSNETHISFYLEQSQHLFLSLFDMNGKLVSNVADEIFAEGKNELTWSTANLNNGIYFLQLQSESRQQRIKLIVAK